MPTITCFHCRRQFVPSVFVPRICGVCEYQRGLLTLNELATWLDAQPTFRHGSIFEPIPGSGL